jgi:hypothetical protein
MRFAPQGPSTSREKLPNGSALAAKARVAVRRDSKLINVLLVDGVAVCRRFARLSFVGALSIGYVA